MSATITGVVTDPAGNAVSTEIEILSLSTPLVLGSGSVRPTTNLLIVSGADGAFSISLISGDYKVTVDATETTEAISFNISVPSTGTYTIDELVTTELTYVYTAPPNQLVDANVLNDVLNPNANFRFHSGQLQFWDAVAYAADNTKPWRALGVNDGQTVWSAPIAD